MTQTDPAVARSATRATGAVGSWTPEQRSAVIASFLAWIFDGFDFFLMVFVVHAVAAEFGTPITSVTLAIVLTLAMRPIGAFVFGRAADRCGRRPTLVVVIVLYSLFELASAFSPNLVFLICIRALFGIAMGGVWGVGASLTMETIPPSARGIVSGLLQAGYPTGYLFAALVYAILFPLVGWRGLFVLGAVPAIIAAPLKPDC
jgi:SHS family lactate transporter-like MFS transporter